MSQVFATIAFCIAVVAPTQLRAQDTVTLFGGTRHKLGFMSGYGDQSFLDVSYTYEVIFLQMQYYYSFHRRRTWGLELLFQPQYNTTNYAHVDGYSSLTPGYEFGLNGGVLIRKNWFDDFLSLYFLLSAGPHYVSGTPERQESGFVFSDNIMGGVNLRFFKGSYLDVRYGYRHLSNANLKKPNLGINNMALNLGIFVVF